jgi:Major Facilitator Superfamily
MRADLANGSETGDEKRRCRKPASDPARVPAIRRRLLPRLSLSDHQCGHSGSTGDGIGARRRRSRPAHFGLLSDLRRYPDTDRHSLGSIWSAADPECIVGCGGGRLGTVRGVGQFSDASGRPGVDRSRSGRRLDRGIEGSCSLVSRGSPVTPKWIDGYAWCALPAELLLVWIGWRELFGLFALLTAACAAIIYGVVPETASSANGVVSVGLRKVYADPRFWRLAPLSSASIGTAWALQGLWAAQWLTEVDGLNRAEVVQHLFAMAVALSLGAILLGVAADRLRRRGVGPELPLGLVAVVFIVTQFALILRLPLPSYFLWAVVAAVGAATVLSFAILAEYFPKELAGRANGALNLCHIAAAFVVQYATGLIVQQWTPEAGHYPEIAYQTAFALNLALQIASWIWFVFSRVRTDSRRKALIQ